MAPPLAQIQSLERKLTKSPADPNPLLPLLALARHPEPEVVHKATWALYRVFGLLLAQGRVGGITTDAAGTNGSSSAVGGEAAGKREVKAWVRDRLLEYIGIVGGLLCDAESSLRTSGLKLLFALLEPLSTASGAPVHLPYFRILLRHVLVPSASLRGARSGSSSKGATAAAWTTVDEYQEGEEGVLPADMVAALVDEYWAPYDDLRLFFFRESAALLAKEHLPHPDNLLAQLVPLTNLPRVAEDINGFFLPSLASAPDVSRKRKREDKDKNTKGKGKKTKGGAELDALPDWMATYDSGDSDDDAAPGEKRTRASALGTHAAVHAIPAHVNAYTSLWEGVFSRVPLDVGWTRRILAGLHGERGILSHLAPARRVRVADWLGATVDNGGAHAMLAMNGLFVLMTQYNLDYPDFYTRLYALLDANVLHVRYRARFFRLLDTFLRSPLLSAALVASFIKRLARLALSAPPAGAVLVIPFVYNLFKRHPGTMVMLHRLPEDMDQQDPYDAHEPKPIATRAINSSVWELAALQGHYLASVATLAKVFAEQFTKPEFNLEDFLDHGYNTLFETEVNRKIKHAPALAVALELGNPADLPSAFPARAAEGERDTVSELWAF